MLAIVSAKQCFVLDRGSSSYFFHAARKDAQDSYKCIVRSHALPAAPIHLS